MSSPPADPAIAEARVQHDDPYELDRVAAWVAQHGFRRVALQFPDEFLRDVPEALRGLAARLPAATKLFVLGDSTYGSSSVDEVAAEHYGADCVVHIGPSDQQHRGNLPVLFVYGRAPLTAPALAAKIAAELQRQDIVDTYGLPSVTSLALVCDVSLQHASDRLAEAMDAALGALGPGSECKAADVGGVLVAVTQSEAAAAGSVGARPRTRRHDWRFGGLTAASWWAAGTPGPLVFAAAAHPEPLRLCGRELRWWRKLVADAAVVQGGSAPSADGPAGRQAAPREEAKRPPPSLPSGPRLLPDRCGLVLCAAASGSPLERRLLLRHGHAKPVWRLDPATGDMERLSSQNMLLQRYRFVELARSAGIVGLVLAATGAKHAQGLADRLEELLRRAGRRTYRFVVGRVTPEKLGNFPGVELFVSLASPEHFPWSSKDYAVPIASPYELEVALGAREWTGEYITDPEELLLSPMPVAGTGPDCALSVQTLGGKARIRQFAVAPSAAEAGSRVRPALPAPVGDVAAAALTPAPALITPGQHGVAQRYDTDLRVQHVV